MSYDWSEMVRDFMAKYDDFGCAMLLVFIALPALAVVCVAAVWVASLLLTGHGPR